ncbi:DUF72 domain-containing protein [Roseomonas sp. KE2513]|uniref:DUF72 domain-containing protein n=1 Tax=Roseomonas sp. KE2513 TaxID=2479202 RepID=UPI0018E03450|nr:DUF72 domain-containing protein [Roseomonas sp. KE2513]MBI0538221.1 DUF72 domain-containing protein [Roseomonas sp. KE2513]
MKNGSRLIGTAGWSIPKQHAESFPGTGSHLERYAARLPAVEINSSFYRPHRPATYARWAASVPPGFRFSVKVPREITHTRRLVDAEEPLDRFLAEVQALGDRLGPLLIQLPPSLRYDQAVVERYFSSFRDRFSGLLACEPRHETWFTDAAEATLAAHGIARVAADPAVVPRAAEPGAWPGLVYHRLHGSPEIYRSPYSKAQVTALARAMSGGGREAGEAWCIFDNTAAGEATHNALQLLVAL